MKLFHTPLFLGITESEFETMKELHSMHCLLYTSDAADEL